MWDYREKGREREITTTLSRHCSQCCSYNYKLKQVIFFKIEKSAVDLLSHGPDANIIGWNFNDWSQEEVQIHVSAKCWSTEWYTVVDHCVYKPKKNTKKSVERVLVELLDKGGGFSSILHRVGRSGERMFSMFCALRRKFLYLLSNLLLNKVIKPKFCSLLNLYFFYGNNILVLRKELWRGFHNGASLYSKGSCVVQIRFQVSLHPLA